VLAEGDAPLTVPTDAKDITVTRDGTVSTSPAEAGHIAIVGFADERAPQPGLGRLRHRGQPTAATGTTILQGMVEDSNVQPIIEMTRMMQISRNFGYARISATARPTAPQRHRQARKVA